LPIVPASPNSQMRFTPTWMQIGGDFP
jgi:hypothetical protein